MANLELNADEPVLDPGETSPTCPYPGMRPFDEAEASLFFGRDRLAEELLTQLEFQPMVLLVGSSGSGKSSVIRAGVLPRWRKKYPGGKVVLFQPGPRPFESLASAAAGFSEAVRQALRSPDPKVLRALQLDPTASGSLGAPPRVLLAIDSFEELFTCAEGTARRDFLDSLVDLARLSGFGVEVLLALRDDVISRFRSHDDFHRIADNSLQRITRLKGDALRECIEAPALARGVRFEEGLAGELKQQMEAWDDGLPLLQDLLSTWWREEDLSDRLLRRATLDRLGGLEHALPRRLDCWLHALSSPDQAAARQVLLELVEWASTPDGSPVTPRPVLRSTLAALSSGALIDSLLRQRLLSARETLASSPDALLELTHEALIQTWPVFRNWVEEVRSATTTRQRLQEDAGRWCKAKGRDKRDLRWRGYHLEQALERQRCGDFARAGGLTAVETRFLQACTRAKALRAFRDRVLSLAAGLVAVVSVSAALMTMAKFQDANSQKHAAEIKAGLGWLARAQHAEGSTEAGFFAAMSTGFDGAGRGPSPGTARTGGFWGFFLANKADPYPSYLNLQDTPARKIEADRRMASAPKPFVWSGPFDPLDGPVQTVAFSLDGKQIASAGGNGRIRLWSVATGTLERVFDGSSSSVQDVDFSPSGKTLASGHEDGSLILWECATGQKTTVFEGHAGSVRAVAFSPSGGLVASAGDDGAIKLWKVETAGETRTLAGHSGPVRCLAFGPGGLALASGGADRSVRVWDIASGNELNILSGHMNAVHALAFSPSGRELASASRNQPVILWDLETHKAVPDLALPASANSLAFSPDGGHLAIAGEDGRFRLWSLGQERSTRVFAGHSGAVRSLAFSPDGKALATGSEDRTVKLWAVRDAWKNPVQLLGPEKPGSNARPPATSEPPERFDWFRYLNEGWVQLDEHAPDLVWRQMPQGLSYATENLPPHSWLGVLRGFQGEEQTRRLLVLALEAQNWEAAVALRQALTGAELPADYLPAQNQAAKLLQMRVTDDLEAGRTALAEWRMRQGDALFGTGQPEWAALRGDYLELKGDTQAALPFYRRINGMKGWQSVARLSPNGKEAVAAWRQVLRAETQHTPALYLTAGRRAAEAGDPSAMREFVSAGVQRFPGDRPLKSALAHLLVDAGEIDEALVQFESLTETNGNPDRNLVATLEKAKCLDPALRLLSEKLDSLRASGPEQVVLPRLQRLVRLYEAANRPEDVIRLLKDRISYLQSVRPDGDLSAPLDELAKALMRGGRRDEALTVMRARVDLLKAQPPGAELSAALLELQSVFSEAGLPGEAIGVLQERIAVQKARPGLPVSALLAELAAALRKAGRQEEAVPVFEELISALHSEKQDPVPAVRELGMALENAGKSSEAWATLRKIAGSPGASAPMLAEVASWGALHGQAGEAAALFEEAAARASGEAERALVNRRRGWALLEAGSPQEAFRVLGMAKAELEASPAAPALLESNLLSGLAAAQWLTDRKGAAIDEYEALCERQKGSERWDDPAFLKNREMPETVRRALLELQAAWKERLSPPQPAKP